MEWRFKHIFRGQPRRHWLTMLEYICILEKTCSWRCFYVLEGSEWGIESWSETFYSALEHDAYCGYLESEHAFGSPCYSFSYCGYQKNVSLQAKSSKIRRVIVGVNKYMEAMEHGFPLGTGF